MTTRAAVLIGVAHAPELPPLQAVHSGVEAMTQWALGQGMPPDAVTVLTDADGGRVTVGAVFEAIAAHIARETLTQLVVYFAGHGINDGQSEQWLLSGAPTNPNEAVNVAASAYLAARCGVPHVVLISDACRTAPVGIRALNIRGGVVFPNLPLSGRPADAVDEFYACLLGDPSLEVREASASAGEYRAVYTEALARALAGEPEELRTPDPDQGEGIDVVRPRPLKLALPALVTDVLRATGFDLRVSQTPDARVLSPDTAWLSRIQRAPGSRGPGRGRGPRGPGADSSSLADVARDAILASTGGGRRSARGGGTPEVPGAGDLQAAGTLLARLDEPSPETLTAGFLVRGTTLTRALSARGELTVADARSVAVDAADAGAPVLLELGTDGCSVLPYLPGYSGVVTVHDGQVVDVAYLPVAGDRAARRRERLVEVRALHEALAAAARMGLLASLRGGDVAPVAERVLTDLELDPSLAVLALYALVDAGRRDLLAEVRTGLQSAVGTSVLDVDLLAGPPAAPVEGAGATGRRFPLLSRTWALEPAVPQAFPALTDVVRVPSLWSLFAADGVETVRRALQRAHPGARAEGGPS